MPDIRSFFGGGTMKQPKVEQKSLEQKSNIELQQQILELNQRVVYMEGFLAGLFSPFSVERSNVPEYIPRTPPK